jgi:fatty-acyl-CoA synthase
VATLKAGQDALDPDQRERIQAKQGRAPFGIDMQIVGSDGNAQPWDGASGGELMVRGHWVIAKYFRGEEASLIADSAGKQWFATGDVAHIDADGYMQITDRSKDVIKSGGEWISSIDLENIAMAHPAVSMAACIGVPHPKWDERPLLVVVRKPGHDLGREELIAFYEGKIAKWWTPDEVVFAESIPLGATGKMLKSRLREQFSEGQLTG